MISLLLAVVMMDSVITHSDHRWSEVTSSNVASKCLLQASGIKPEMIINTCGDVLIVETMYKSSVESTNVLDHGDTITFIPKVDHKVFACLANDGVPSTDWNKVVHPSYKTPEGYGWVCVKFGAGGK